MVNNSPAVIDIASVTSKIKAPSVWMASFLSVVPKKILPTASKFKCWLASSITIFALNISISPSELIPRDPLSAMSPLTFTPSVAEILISSSVVSAVAIVLVITPSKSTYLPDKFNLAPVWIFPDVLTSLSVPSFDLISIRANSPPSPSIFKPIELLIRTSFIPSIMIWPPSSSVVNLAVP